MEFIKSAKEYARNPLGIVALFISLIYGFASLLLGTSADKLDSIEKWPLLIFIVTFPFAVLLVFYKLVTNHHGKLYSPSDYQSDASFLSTLSRSEKYERVETIAKEILNYQPSNTMDDVPIDTAEIGIEEEDSDDTGRYECSMDHDLPGMGLDITQDISYLMTMDHEVIGNSDIEADYTSDEITLLRTINRINQTTSYVINLIKNNLNISPKTDVRVGSKKYVFDAIYLEQDKYTLLDVMYYSKPMMINNSVGDYVHKIKMVAKHSEIDMDFIVALINDGESSEFQNVVSAWKKIIHDHRCNVEVMVINGSEIPS